MSTLTVLAFQNEQEAEQMLGILKNLQARNLIKVEDAALLTRTIDGKPKIRQANDLVGAGALGGAFWGLLMGLLFFIPLIGIAIGTGMGALFGKMADICIDDDFIERVSHEIQPGKAAVFILTREAEVMDKATEALIPYHYTMIHTSFSKEDEAHLRETLGLQSQKA